MQQSRTLYDLLLCGMCWYREDCEVVYRNKIKPYYDMISTITNQHTLYQIGWLYCALVKTMCWYSKLLWEPTSPYIASNSTTFFRAHYPQACDICTESALQTHVLCQRYMGFLLYLHKVLTTIVCGLYNGYHWDITKYNMPWGRGSKKKGNSVRT